MKHMNLNNNHIGNDTFKHKINEKLIDIDKKLIDFDFLIIFLVDILHISNTQLNF